MTRTSRWPRSAGRSRPGRLSSSPRSARTPPAVIDSAAAELGGTVIRRSAADVYDEIQSAKAAQDAADHEARKVLRDQRRAEHKDKWEQFKNKVKSAVG